MGDIKHYDAYLERKLMLMPEEFRKLFHVGEWAQAKYIYDTALRICAFMEVPDEVRVKLFGERQSSDESKHVAGLFIEDHVQKVYLECAVKKNIEDECRESQKRSWLAQARLQRGGKYTTKEIK